MNPTPSPAPKKKRRSKARPKSEHKIPERKRKEIVYELSPQDRLCFSCPLPDCVGEQSVQCPINKERLMLRLLKKRQEALVQIEPAPAPERRCGGCNRLYDGEWKHCDDCRARQRRRYAKRAGLSPTAKTRIAKQNRSEIDNTPAPMRSAAWND